MRVLHNIKALLDRANGEYEVGGLLLGWRIMFIYLVIEITVPCDMVEASATSFVLDGGYHKKEAEHIAENYRPRLSVLGIWHSHIRDGAHFSKDDREINCCFSQLLNGTLSAIAVHDISLNRFSLATYYIARNGTEYAMK